MIVKNDFKIVCLVLQALKYRIIAYDFHAYLNIIFKKLQIIINN